MEKAAAAYAGTLQEQNRASCGQQPPYRDPDSCLLDPRGVRSSVHRTVICRTDLFM